MNRFTIIAFIVGFVIGFIIVGYGLKGDYTREAAKHQCGQYNAQTGNFEWKDK